MPIPQGNCSNRRYAAISLIREGLDLDRSTHLTNCILFEQYTIFNIPQYGGFPMIPEDHTRREFITVGALATIGVAGCLGGDDGDDTEPADDHDDHDGDDDHDDDDYDDHDGDDDHDDDDHDDHGNGDHDHDTDHEPGHPENHVTVEMMSMDDKEHFIPHVVHLDVGGTITWELVDDLEEHDTTAFHPLYDKPLRLTDEDEHWQSPEINEQGETWERTFEVEGVYDYFCGPHYEDDMLGRVIVGWPDPDPDEHPALAPPEDELEDNEQDMIEMFNEATMPVLEDGPQDH